jgi:hypothetical protein
MIAKLLLKEMKLAANPLSYIFIAFSAMTMIPGYPILCGAFFVCLGIFYTYQQMRECDDITYTVLLPVRKRDVVTAKFLFAVLIELFSFAVCAALTAVRMTALRDAAVYVNNPMMNANLAYLGGVLLIFAMFNVFFLGGFFKTAYQIGIPFVTFCAAAFLIVFVGEAIHHVPGFESLNQTAGIRGMQLAILTAGAAVYAAGTLLSHRISVLRFERINL